MHYGRTTDNYENLFSEHSNHHSGTKSQLRDLQARVEKLELISEALWEILQKETRLSEADLIERITEIDLRDGKFDQKKKKTPAVECRKCHRMNSKRHSRCLYCGEIFLVGPFE
jgi:formylmethanofuran dehydrogenase subunit E